MNKKKFLLLNINMKKNIKTNFILKRIKSRKSIITVIGLGYVGLPLCVALLKSKFKVFGIDNDLNRVVDLKKGNSYISTIKNFQLQTFVKNKKFIPTNNFEQIKYSDVIIICVPTPIDKKKQPNMKYVKSVVLQIDKFIKKNQTIILESTSYPGTTEEYFLPIFKKKKLTIGKNIFLGYSPEREDPGNKKFSIIKKNLSKVISGYSTNCTKIVKEVYKTVSNKVYQCNDIKTAEFTKLLENIYRSVNIGLVNELHSVCKKMGINIFDALKAAETKPFGFKAFYPGPGVGGNCIPIDPYYLAYKANKFGVKTDFIKLAGKINDERPTQICNLVSNFISKKKLKRKILILGITYKKNSDDVKESPVVKIYKGLSKRVNNRIHVCDPLISNLSLNILKKINFVKLNQLKNKKFLKSFDICLVGTNHDVFKYDFISKNIKNIFDTRNSFKKYTPNITIV